MQLLTFKNHHDSIMKKNLCMLCIVFMGFMVIPVHSAFAIGKWNKGVVNAAPWKERFTYIKIDNTKYTIMKGAKIVYVYKNDRDQHEGPLTVASLHKGDLLVFLAEGNRIYLIKRIRR